MIRLSRNVILWVPAALLALVAITIILYTTSNNDRRLDNIEDRTAKPLIFIYKIEGQDFQFACSDPDPGNTERTFVCAQVPAPKPPNLTPSPPQTSR